MLNTQTVTSPPREGEPAGTVLVRPQGLPSRGEEVTVYVLDMNQPSLPTPFHSVLVSVSVFMALSLYFIP